jgi:hypothetical protein
VRSWSSWDWTNWLTFAQQTWRKMKLQGNPEVNVSPRTIHWMENRMLLAVNGLWTEMHIKRRSSCKKMVEQTTAAVSWCRNEHALDSIYWRVLKRNGSDRRSPVTITRQNRSASKEIWKVSRTLTVIMSDNGSTHRTEKRTKDMRPGIWPMSSCEGHIPKISADQIF